jgi:hypothetical protein
MNIDDLKFRILQFVNSGDLAAFRTWFAPLVLEIDQLSDRELIRLACSVERDLADFDEDFLDEYNLRENLRAKLFPSAAAGSLVFASVAHGGIVAGTSTTLATASVETVPVSVGAVSAWAL